MELDPALLLDSVVSGLLLGCLYAIAAVGVAISFGMLDIVNIAHPPLMVLAAFLVVSLRESTGIDPLLAAVLLTPVFWAGGALLYRAYWRFFERRGDEAIQGLAFFFGLLFIIEVGAGDGLRRRPAGRRRVSMRATRRAGPGRPCRCACSCRAACRCWPSRACSRFLRRSFMGRAIAAVAQDRPGAAVPRHRPRADQAAWRSACPPPSPRWPAARWS